VDGIWNGSGDWPKCNGKSTRLLGMMLELAGIFRSGIPGTDAEVLAEKRGTRDERDIRMDRGLSHLTRSTRTHTFIEIASGMRISSTSWQ
jgi:hypothetical protein